MRTAPAWVLAMAIASATAFAGNTATTATDDTGLTAKVKTALISNDNAKAHQINVETKEGVVQLSGFVDSETARTAAVAAASQVSGVKSVQNKLLIRDANRSGGQAVDDTVIAAKLKTELAGKTGLGTATDVNVEVNSGVVELSGFVPTLDQKTRAGEIARGINGVKEVQNNISLKPQS
jgi:hyperosmotically inducible protein